jgi:hypothetical protein
MEEKKKRPAPNSRQTLCIHCMRLLVGHKTKNIHTYAEGGSMFAHSPKVVRQQVYSHVI